MEQACEELKKLHVSEQQKLLDSEKRYATAIKGAHLGVWEYHVKEHVIIGGNETFVQHNLPTMIENVPESLFPQFGEVNKNKLENMYRRLDAGEQDVSEVFEWWPFNDKASIWEKTYYTMTYDSEGKPDIAYGISINVTDQVREKERFGNFMKTILAVNQDALFTFELNLSNNSCAPIGGRMQYMVDELNDETADGFFEKVCASAVDSAIRENARKTLNSDELIGEYEKGNTMRQTDIVRLDDSGKLIWIRICAAIQKNPESGDIGCILYALDVTREKNRDKMYSIISNQAYDYTMILNMDNGICELNSINESLIKEAEIQKITTDMNYSYEYVRYMPFSNIEDEVDRKYCLDSSKLSRIKKEMDEKGNYEFIAPSRYLCDGGNIRYCKFQHFYISRENETILVLCSDVTSTMTQLTEEKELRIQADAANAAKTDFLSRMSHDMRTPLNGIMGMTHLAKSLDKSPEMLDCLEKIDTSSKFLLTLINDVLDMAKAESGRLELHPEPYYFADFDKYINSVIVPLCDEKNQTLTFDSIPLDGIVPKIDILHINQVYFNLLSNAVKFTPEGGRIAVRLREHLSEENKDCIEVSIKDNGIGMSKEFMSMVFEPFTQENRRDASDYRGSGLGLAIVKKIVEAMDGEITVSSTEGEGTEFRFYILCDYIYGERSKPVQESDSIQAAEDKLKGKHILMCEDHPMNQEIARALLEAKGMLVDIAENGEIGVEKFSKSNIGFYNAILMDIRMPVLDGYEATKIIRNMNRADSATVPIIAMTADAFADDVRRCLTSGMQDHVSKPVEPKILYEKLAAAIK